MSRWLDFKPRSRLRATLAERTASFIGNRADAGKWVRLPMMKLELHVEIDAPAAAAWAVLGERFGDLGAWAAPIASSSLDGELGVGAIRTCQIATFGPLALGTVRERLIAFDPGRMTLAYESVDGLPAFLTSAVNYLSIQNL